MTQNPAPKIVNEEPWPKEGIENYRSPEQGTWGYLLTYDDGTFYFDETRQPSADEIYQRWSIYLSKDNKIGR